jgi:predicted amidophosphoribosyltransferase
MKVTHDPSIEGSVTCPKHEIEIVCAACGYDLDASELDADTCSDCGAPLNLKQSVAIHATTVPAAGGGIM